jgi:glutamate 5-kinase
MSYVTIIGESSTTGAPSAVKINPTTGALIVEAPSFGGSSTSVQPTQGSLTSRSGTITSGGTSQQLAAANTSRKYLLVQNVSTGDLWISFGATAATTSQPSIKLQTNGSLVMEDNFVTTQAINIIGSTTGQPYTAYEA